ncbi:glycoprotein 3-alpha-L-fucosyltransferase A-like [Mytilus edulis]|uniref:glycoprotein 3-alpha-L-fucosyltransferase A-like n=1 Tax=Mytilus edulis TaxID=6550 RepID=UPI0039EF2F44
MHPKDSVNSILTIGNFTKSKPFQRVVTFVFTAILITVGLSMILDSLRIKFQKEVDLNKFEDASHDGLILHDSRSDNYDKSGMPYNVTDLLPQKRIRSPRFEPVDDRIHLQISHVPKSYQYALDNKVNIPMKLLYFHGSERQWYLKEGQTYFLKEKCPVNRCLVTYKQSEGINADAVVFLNPFTLPSNPPWPRRSVDQIWAMYSLEAPHNTNSASGYRNYFNWTMTYRRDSTITTPYFKFLYYKQPLPKESIETNLAIGKTKKVAWMVSNCNLVRSGRMTYARQLAKYINIDIYGACGNKSCRKSDPKKCYAMIKQNYKFYLAFENSKCLGYYTEKFSQNALRNNAIPVVLGVSRAEIKAAAPPGSYIHVEDFDSPKQLADYLHRIDKDDNLFNEYFRWKRYGKMTNTKTWCRLCSMLHEKSLPSVTQTDIDTWRSKSCIGARKWGY